MANTCESEHFGCMMVRDKVKHTTFQQVSISLKSGTAWGSTWLRTCIPPSLPWFHCKVRRSKLVTETGTVDLQCTVGCHCCYSRTGAFDKQYQMQHKSICKWKQERASQNTQVLIGINKIHKTKATLQCECFNVGKPAI